MKQIQRVAEKKTGKKWEQTFVTTDEKEVYESLARDLIAKKIHHCSWIVRISDDSNYDGTRKIVVTYDNGCRSIYTVKA